MKVFYIFGTAAAGVLGYFMEPGLRLQLTGQAPTSAEMATNGKVVMQVAEGTNVDLETLTPEQLPKRITLNTSAKVADAASGIAMTIEAGTKVNLVRVEAGNAVISPGEGPFIGKIPVVETDLLQQLAANPPVIAKPATETPAETTPPVADVAPAPAGESADADMAATEPPPAPEPAPEATPEPAPAPEPAPEVAAKPDIPEASPITKSDNGGAAAAAPGSEEIVAAMQASVKAGQIKEFTFDQVTEWLGGENETIDGEAYQTGIASYSAETIFGNKVIQAKALVKGGKVARWIWPKSGMEIK